MGPLYSLGARGAFGLYHPGRSSKYPGFLYPIALRTVVPTVHYPHIYGWYYQLRRTWHGIVWAAHRYTKPTNPQTTKQQTWRGYMAEGVYAWQGMDVYTKDIYEKWRYPIHASGFNRFLRCYLKERRRGG